MQPGSNNPRGASLDSLARSLEQKLEDEQAALGTLVAELGKGRSHPEIWKLLHEAARRDDRAGELALAYERACQPKALRPLPAAAQAELLMHAGELFADEMSDLEGAVGYFERVLAMAPLHEQAFERLEHALVERADGAKLCELYAQRATHQPERAEQLRLLRKAVELIDVFDLDEAKSAPIYERILKIEPGDAEARRALEARYRKAGKPTELVKLFEGALSAEGALSPEASVEVRGKLVALYVNEVKLPDRAMAHIEELLSSDPSHAAAREAARQLCDHRALGPRAAAALEQALSRSGRPGEDREALKVLSQLVEMLRGPAKLEAQKRLARGKAALEPDGEALVALERAVAADPGDDELRSAYRELGKTLDRMGDVTKLLLRLGPGAKGPELKARLHLEAGQALLEAGEKKRARAALSVVLEASSDASVLLPAARALEGLLAEAREPKALCEVLEKLAAIEPEAPAREQALSRLAHAAENELHDLPRAIEAHRALLETPRAEASEAALEGLYEQAGRWADLVSLLERRSGRGQGDSSRKQALRAAQIRAEQLGDVAGALDSLARLAERSGPSAELGAARASLFERAGKWAELAALLDDEARGGGPDRGRVLARLARVRLERLGDEAGALEACREVIAGSLSAQAGAAGPGGGADDVAEAGEIAERVLSSGKHRLLAASVLEPLRRRQGDGAGLLRLLEARAEGEGESSARLDALAEAAQIAEGARAARLAARGLSLSLSSAPGRAGELLALIETRALGVLSAPDHAALLLSSIDEAGGSSGVGGAGAEGAEVAEVVASALARAGELWAETGQAEEALAAYRRALAASPSSFEARAGVDRMLRALGRHDERLSHLRWSLSLPAASGERGALLREIARLERERGGASEAVAALREAIEHDPADHQAHLLLLEALSDSGDERGLYEALARSLLLREGSERLPLLRRMADLSLSLGEAARAADHHRESIHAPGGSSDESLSAAERAAVSAGDRALLREVLSRRVAQAIEPTEEASWLERLGEALSAEPGEEAAAASSWKRAASLLEGEGDLDRASALYERALSARPTDDEALSALARAYRGLGAWGKLLSVGEARLASARPGPEAASALFALEEAATRAGAATTFARAVDRAIAEGLLPAEARREALEAKARALSTDPALIDQASAAYRQLLEQFPREARAFEAFEALVGASPVGAARRDDLRWIHAHRAASSPEPLAALLAWAEAEETVLGDASAAIDVYRRALLVDPGCERALSRLPSLLLSRGDAEGARGALLSRRARAEGEARRGIDLELAALLADRLGKPDEALSALLPVLDARADDPDAVAVATRVLGRVAADPSKAAVRRRAIDVLERALSASGSPEIVHALLEATSGSGELASSRRAWLERLLGEAHGEAALSLSLRAAREMPAEHAFWDRAEALSRELGRADEVAEAYREALSDAAIAAEIGQRAADFHEEWFEDESLSVGLLERVLTLDPSAFWAFARLKAMYGASERWADLLALHDRAIAHAGDDEERQVLLEDAAQIARDFAGDDARAVGYLEQLFALRPGDERVAQSLERLYERCGRHRALIDLLARQLASLDAEGAQRQRARLALLWLEGVGDAARAFGVVDDMLSIEPDRDEALSLLERVLAHPAPPPASPRAQRQVAEVRRKAAHELEVRYLEQGRFDDLARVLGLEIEQAAGKKERAKLLKERCAIRLERLGDKAGAFDDTAALLALDPRSAELRDRLVSLGDELGAHDKLAGALAEIAAQNAGKRGSASLWLSAARVAEARQGDLPRAAEWLERSLVEALDRPARSGKRGSDDEAGAPERDVALAAATQLEKVLAALGRKPERYDALKRVAELEVDAGSRRVALAEMARLAWDDLVDPQRAAKAFRARLADDPRDLEALSGLCSALERQELWGELVEALDRRSRLSPDPASRRADLLKIARVQADALGQPEQALSALKRARDEHGADDEIIEAEASLFARSGKHDDLVALLEERAQAEREPHARAATLRRLGDALRVHGKAKSASRAVAVYAEALAIEPASEQARRGLEALASDRDHGEPAVRALLERYAAIDDWRAAAELLELRLLHAHEPVARARALRETARLWDTRGHDPARAFDCVCRALLSSPSDLAAADEILSLADRTMQWPAAVESLSRAASADVPAEVARVLLWRVAEVQRERDPEGAERALERALEHAPGDAELLAALVELRRRRPGQALVDALVMLAEARGGDVALLREAGEVAEGPLAEPRLASSLAERILEELPRRLGLGPGPEPASFGDSPVEHAADWAVGLLVREAEGAGDQARLASVLTRGASLPFERARSKAMRRRAAETYERALGDLDAAIALLEKSIGVEPDDGPALEQLAQLYRRKGRLPELLSIRQRQIALSPSGDERLSLRLELSRLCRDTGDVDGAVLSLRQALAEAPESVEAVADLEALFEATGQSAELLALLEQQAERREKAGDERAAEAWARAAQVADERLGDPSRALSAHKKAASLGRVASLEAVARLCVERGAHAEAIAPLEKLLSIAPPAEQASRGLRLADAQLAAGMRDRARQTLERLSAEAPEPDAVRARLADIYRDDQDWPRLADLMALEADRAKDPRVRALRLREAAELLLARGGDPSQAASMLEQAESLAPDDVGVQLARAEALRSAGRLDEAGERLKKLLASYGTRRPKDRALAHFQMGMLLAAGGDPRAALAELDAAQKIDPAHPRILHASGKLALEAGELDRAQRSLRALLLMLPRGNRPEGSLTPPPARVETARASGEEGPTSAPPSSLSTLPPSASMRPSIAAGAAGGAGGSGGAAMAAGVTRGEVQLLLAQLAERQGDAAKAEEMVETAFSLARESEVERAAVERALRASGKHALLARALEARASSALDRGKQADALAELASLYLRHLGRSDDAVRSALRALRIRPGEASAHQVAREICLEAGRVDEYALALSRLADDEPTRITLGPRASAELWLRLGEVALGDLRDDARATHAFRQGWALARELPRPAGDDLASRAIGALEAVFARTGDTASLGALLEEQLAEAEARGEGGGEGEGERASLSLRLVELRLFLGGPLELGVAALSKMLDDRLAPERAVETLSRAVAAHPDSEPLLRLQERVSREAGDRRGLCEVLLRLGDLPGQGPSPLREAAEIALDLGDERLAESALRKLIDFELDPQARDDARWALVALAGLSERAGNAGLAASLKERAAELSRPSDRRSLLLEVARLYEGPLNDPARAARLYAQLLEADPDDLPLRSPLASLYRRLGDDRALEALLGPMISASLDPAERSRLRLELSHLLLREQPSPSPSSLSRAVGLLDDVLADEPDHAEATELLTQVLERAGDLSSLCRHLARRLDAARDRGDRALTLSLSSRLGGLYEQSGRLDDALEVFRSGLDLSPDNAPLLEAVARLAEGKDDTLAVEALEKLLAVAPAEQAEAIATRLAGLHDAAWNHEGAERALEAAFARRPSLSLREQLAQRYTEASAWRKLADLHASEARRASSAAERAAGLRRAADVLKGRAGDPAGAASLLEQAMAESPPPLDLSLLLSLLESLSQGKAPNADARASAALAQALATGRRSAKELVDALTAKGLLDQARAQLEAQLRSRGNDEGALRALASIEAAGGRPEAALSPLARLAERATGEALTRAALELADAADRAGKPEAARAALERARREAPGREIASRLRALYERVGARRELAQIVRDEAEASADSPGKQADLLAEAGRLLLDPREGDPRLAVQLLERAREIRPDDDLTLLLADALSAQNRARDGLSLLASAIAAHKGRRSAKVGQLHQRKARLELSLGDRPQALASLARAFECDAGNGALAVELGQLALEMGDEAQATRAFRAITLMKVASQPGDEGTTAQAKANAYLQLALLSLSTDRRKARLLAEKAVAEDPSLEPARKLRDELKAG